MKGLCRVVAKLGRKGPLDRLRRESGQGRL